MADHQTRAALFDALAEAAKAMSSAVYADDAVLQLAGWGRSAVRLEDGFPEWAGEQLPVERVER